MALLRGAAGALAAGGPPVDSLLLLLPDVEENRRQVAAKAAMGAALELPRGERSEEVTKLTSLILAGSLPSGVRIGESNQEKAVSVAQRDLREEGIQGTLAETGKDVKKQDSKGEGDRPGELPLGHITVDSDTEEVDEEGEGVTHRDEAESKEVVTGRIPGLTGEAVDLGGRARGGSFEVDPEIELVDKELDEALERARSSSGSHSPLKALIQPALNWWRSPKKRPAPRPEELWEEMMTEKVEKGRRKDTPWLSGTSKGAQFARANLRGVLRAAQKLKERRNKKLPIEDLFEANSSKGATVSRRKTVKKIMDTLGACFPLSSTSLMEVASALKLAGYKAGVNYLVDCKIWHVEEGHPWSELLDRTFKKCKRGLERGKGPRKKAPEVPECTRRTAREERANSKKASICFARELFEFGMCWMLREAELAVLSTTHVRIDHILKRVRLRIPVSKKDQEGEGVHRVLQCLCGEGRCRPECSYEVAQDLLDKLQRKSAGASKLCVTKQGKPATKAKLVASWQAVFGQPVSGHSARRTGALEYIRAGWSVGQVAHLGRWKSNVILQYAEEALASMPANLVHHGGQVGHPGMVENASVVDPSRLEEWKESLLEEVNLLKVKVKDVTEEDKEKKELWRKLARETQGKLPLKVQSRRQQVVHVNLARSVASPPIGWRTACGWHFYGNNFVFVENICEVTCDKCKVFCAESQRGG